MNKWCLNDNVLVTEKIDGTLPPTLQQTANALSGLLLARDMKSESDWLMNSEYSFFCTGESRTNKTYSSLGGRAARKTACPRLLNDNKE